MAAIHDSEMEMSIVHIRGFIGWLSGLYVVLI